MADKILQAAAGAKFEVLHGCVGEDCDHVFGDKCEAEYCPKCNTCRYDEDGEANETVFYFPLKERLQALVRAERYRHILNFEHRRKQNSDYFTDVYDCPGEQSHYIYLT